MKSKLIFYIYAMKQGAFAFWRAAHVVETVIALLVGVFLVFNETFATKFGLDGISPLWCLVPFLVLVAHFLN